MAIAGAYKQRSIAPSRVRRRSGAFVCGLWAAAWLAACSHSDVLLGDGPEAGAPGSPPREVALAGASAAPAADSGKMLQAGTGPGAGTTQDGPHAAGAAGASAAGVARRASGGDAAAGAAGFAGSGAAGAPAAGSSAADGGALVPSEPPLPNLPKVAAPCPELKGNGVYTFTADSGRRMRVLVYMSANAKHAPGPGGPLILYWHATGGTPSEVVDGFGQPAIDETVAAGGVVAAFTSTTCFGCTTTDDLVWFAEDDGIADAVVSCAVAQAKIDTRRIHTLGWSAGGMHTMYMALSRSNYVASVVSYSGGIFLNAQPQDPNNRVPSILSFSPDDVFVFIRGMSLQWYDTYEPKGYYTMLCDHSQGHTIPAELAAVSSRFFYDHPFKRQTEPYAQQIPSEFPAYCANQLSP